MYHYYRELFHTLLKQLLYLSPHERDSGIRGMFSSESGILAFGIRNTAKGIRTSITIEIRNPSSNDKVWNPLPEVRNPQRGIQNSRLSWMPLHGAEHRCNPVPTMRSPSLCLFKTHMFSILRKLSFHTHPASGRRAWYSDGGMVSSKFDRIASLCGRVSFPW